jgi:hypothetical protein
LNSTTGLPRPSTTRADQQQRIANGYFEVTIARRCDGFDLPILLMRRPVDASAQTGKKKTVITAAFDLTVDASGNTASA